MLSWSFLFSYFRFFMSLFWLLQFWQPLLVCEYEWSTRWDSSMQTVLISSSTSGGSYCGAYCSLACVSLYCSVACVSLVWLCDGVGSLSFGGFLVMVAELAVAYPSSSVGYWFSRIGWSSGKCNEQTQENRFGCQLVCVPSPFRFNSWVHRLLVSGSFLSVGNECSVKGCRPIQRPCLSPRVLG